eukprot:1857488-Karenia_brevis.AAC.1
MGDIKENEVKAEKLSEVSAKPDAQENFLTTALDRAGSAKIKKGAHDQTIPKNSDELRTKITLMENMWCFLRCKHLRPWLDGMTPS